MVQWLRIHTSSARGKGLAGELRSHISYSWPRFFLRMWLISFLPSFVSFISLPNTPLAFLDSSVCKESSWKCRDAGFIPKSEISAQESDRLPISVFLGFPVAPLVKNLPEMRQTWVWPLGWDDLPRWEATHLRYSQAWEIQDCIVHGLHRFGHDWDTFTFNSPWVP